MSLVGDGGAVEEGIASLLCGMLFGATTVLVGHPLDTVKTRMQADSQFKSFNTIQAIGGVYKEGGIRGFYRGGIPPLIGSTFFRSIQFAAYGATMGYFREESSVLRTTKLGSIEARVLLGGALAGICRSLIEAPLDVLKTRQQTCSQTSLRSIPIRDLTRGFSATVARNAFLLTIFFACIDLITNKRPNTHVLVKGGVATTTAWTVVWPLDVTKSRMQSLTHVGSGNPKTSTVLIETIRDGSMFRGYFAGISRSFAANGASLVAYQWGQKMRLKLNSRWYVHLNYTLYKHTFTR